MRGLLQAIYKLAFRQYLAVAGRTHGVHAEPTTLGLKLLGHYAELHRADARLAHAIQIARYENLGCGRDRSADAAE